MQSYTKIVLQTETRFCNKV